MKSFYGAVLSLMLVTLVAANSLTDEEILEREKGKPDSRCPEGDDPENPVHLSHPTDCTVFYKCYLGNAYLMDCPRAMKWNATANMCDEKIGPCKIPVLFNASPKKASNELAKETDNPCPYIDDPDHPAHYPHPFECNLFYKCSHSISWLQECPEGLHWSTETDQCERPEDANCQTQ